MCVCVRAHARWAWQIPQCKMYDMRLGERERATQIGKRRSVRGREIVGDPTDAVCKETDVENTVYIVVAAKTYSAVILSVNF